MRPVRFLVPGTTGKFRCGGLLVELQTAGLLSGIAPVQLVTYRQREAEHPFLGDLLRQEGLPDRFRGPLWIVSWGFDVPKLLRRLRGHAVAYHAHSSGYGFDLPAGVPVLAVSRNTLGYWGARSPRNPLFLVPNALDPQWIERGVRDRQAPRSIDVLVQRRKNSTYVLEQLVPALRARGLTVVVQDGWVEDLVALFNDARVVLYDSAEYWRGRNLTEGFGLPPIEALAAGCVVFSSLNHALSDLLEPGRLGHQIGCARLAYDVERIEAAARDPGAWLPEPGRLERLLQEVSEAAALAGWQRALAALEALEAQPGPDLLSPPSWRLRWYQRFQRLRQKGSSLITRLRPAR